ncbi:MAG: hypothetical protein HC888_02365 [Candidatus Competibacteraceae bacterium]|nr:hypothetical protein [Candidatus Competibacteraceae bacterium]
MSIMSGEDLIRDALSGVKKKVSLINGVKVDAPTEGRYVDWDDIKICEKPRKTRKQLQNWVTGDFVGHIRFLHFKRYNKDWDVNYKGACQQVLQMKDVIVDFVGFCDNIVLKDYIDIFFEKYADKCVAKDGHFMMCHLYRYGYVEDFAQTYDYNARLRSLESPLNAPKPQDVAVISDADVSEAYALSPQRLLTEYGVVIAVNWLNQSCGMTLRDAAKLVHKVGTQLWKNGQFEQVIRATENMGPYPKSLRFLDADTLVKKIYAKLAANVEVVENDPRFAFLMSKK